MARLLLLWHNLGNGDQNFNSQKSDTVLVVICKMLEEWDHLLDNDCRWHLLHKLREVVGSLSSDHRCLIMDEETELLTELLLHWWRGLLVWSMVKSSRRDLRCEPIRLRKPYGEWNEVLLNLLHRQLLADLVQRLDGLL